MIYLDHAATTPVDPAVADAMTPYLFGSEQFGNPSSIHRYGRQAREAVDRSRDMAAELISSDYSEVFFTSGGTEADNLAIVGFMSAAPAERNHLVVSGIEHHAVLYSAHYLQTLGYDVTTALPNGEGIVEPDAIADAMTSRTALVSVMHANNEIGSIQPIEQIAEIAHRGGARFHTDAVQSVGSIAIDVRTLGVDMLTMSAHKIYGPKAVGALYVKQGVRLSPLLHGGAQEREKRAGTENVAGIVGFGAAARLAGQRRDEDAPRIAGLRDRLVDLLHSRVPGIRTNGSIVNRLPNMANVSVEGVEGTTLLMNLDRGGVAASSGSACSSGSIEPSHVLKAIGLSQELASSGIRFSLGRRTTIEEIESCAEVFASAVAKIRQPRS